MSEPPSLTLVLPAFDEAERLPSTLSTIRRWLLQGDVPGLVAVVVCDDGSSDDSRRVVGSFTAEEPRIVCDGDRHRGKGAALRRGFLGATTELVAFLDADLPITLESLLDLLTAANDADLVIGSRVGPGATFIRPQPLVRRWGGRAFVRAVGLLGYDATSDPQCGAKVLRRAEMESVVRSTRSDRFAFDVELISAAAAAGRRVVESPVAWIHVPGSTVRPWRDVVSTLAQLRSIRQAGDRSGR